ncbi:MAG: CcmD family protein [Armatimonadetes bacterium]|nr:CcmD family protein [Armatimonadota bacterium]MDW8121335.1 CcmD family protein [Armatimonadota bacterium]
MEGALPFFLVWLVTWAGLMAYLFRLDLKVRQLEEESEKTSTGLSGSPVGEGDRE